MDSVGLSRVETLIQQGYSVKIGQSFRRGWEIFQQNWGGFVGFTVILLMVGVVLALFPERLQPIASVINMVISPPLTAGLLIVAFRLAKRRSAEFSDFFSGFSFFLPLFIANLLVAVFVAIGLVLLILPGLYLAVAYVFTTGFIVDKNLDFWQAMELSRRLVTKRWFAFLGLSLLLVLVNLVGVIPIGLGLLVTIPFSYCVIAAAYEDVVGLAGSESLEPSDR